MSVATGDSSHRKLAKTRIIATMGPACEDIETIRQLIIESVDIFRFNFAHGKHEWLAEILERIRQVQMNFKRLSPF